MVGRWHGRFLMLKREEIGEFSRWACPARRWRATGLVPALTLRRDKPGGSLVSNIAYTPCKHGG